MSTLLITRLIQNAGVVTVIERPTCNPPPSKLPDLREGSPYFMNCSARVFGGNLKDLHWAVGNKFMTSKREDGEQRATAIMEYIAAIKVFIAI